MNGGVTQARRRFGAMRSPRSAAPASSSLSILLLSVLWLIAVNALSYERTLSPFPSLLNVSRTSNYSTTAGFIPRRRPQSGRLFELESVAELMVSSRKGDAPTSRSANASTQASAQAMGNTTTLPPFHHNESSTSLYKVIRVVPETGQQLQFLDQLEVRDTLLKLNFWTSPARVGSVVDIMVSFANLMHLRRLLEMNDLKPEVIIEDVERLIIQREHKSIAPNRKSNPDRGFGPRFRDDPSDLSEDEDALSIYTAGYDFYRYGSYAQMISWMRMLANRYPNIVSYISIGRTHEGRSIDGLEIGVRGTPGTSRKRIFWIDGGIHAREWAAPHTCLFFIHQLTSKYGRDTNITRMVNDLTWLVIPLLNPDGYEYTRSSTNPNIRLWRKNRSPNRCSHDRSWRCCKGVDLNRNFDFHFRESGSSDDPCSEIFQGPEAFSEPEARAVRDAVLSNRYRGRIDGFITLHTYSQIWVHPYGHKKDSYPGDIHDLYTVGKRATVALSKLYGTKYILGSGADTLYPASGGSEDWAKETAAIKFVYLLELRPDEKSWDGFILDETLLIPTATETWAGVKVVADAIMNRARSRMVAHRLAGSRQHRFGESRIAPCSDLRNACKRWVQESETLCSTVPVFMREQCAKSCGFC